MRAALAIALLAALGGRAAADGVPVGRYGFSLGARQNVGSLGGAFGRGLTFGVEAGYLPGQLGATWAVRWGYFKSSDASRADSTLWLLEMDLGLRFREPLGENAPRFLIATGGLTLMRSNIPIPPDESRLYYGPYVGFGLEQLLFSSQMFAFEARYGLVAGGPAGLTLLLTYSFGS